jgi:hypothetical protein
MRCGQESETPSASNTPQTNGSTLQLPTTTLPSRKRKRAPAVTASSPAPSDQGSNGHGANPTEYVSLSSFLFLKKGRMKDFVLIWSF